jgi:hypothetical protein
VENLTANSYLDLDGNSPTNIYCAAVDGLVHFDGAGWSPIAGPRNSQLFDVWVAADGDVYATGFYESWRYDGSSWERFYKKEETGNGNAAKITDIWGRDESNLYIASQEGIVQFDAGLNPVDTVAASDCFNAIWGLATGEIFAVGPDGLVMHYTGSSWIRTSIETGGYLDCIHGSGPADVYAAGSRVLFRYDGASWQGIDLPGVNWGITAIRAVAPNDLFVLDSVGRIGRFNGAAWETMTRITGQYLCAAWGAPDDLFAVGQSGKIIHFDGTRWTPVRQGKPRYPSLLRGDRNGNLYLAGGGEMYRYDGLAYEELPPVSAHDLWVTDRDDILAVGAGGVVLRFDGSKWRHLDSPTGHHLGAVWGMTDGTAYAVGDDQTAVRIEGTAVDLIFEDPGSDRDFFDVWATPDVHVFAVGGRGTLGGFDGTLWTFHDAVTANDLYTVWGSSEHDVFAVGAGGTVLRFDGNIWIDMSMPPELQNTASPPGYVLSGTGPKNVYLIVPRYGNSDIFRFNGSAWNLISDDLFLCDAWMDGAGTFFALDYFGEAFYSYRP